MVKIIYLEIVNPHSIICFFNTNEKRVLNIDKVFDTDDEFVKKILQPDMFCKAKIGQFGEILWENVGEIRELDGTITLCEYDISPEFAYHNSFAC